MMFKRLHNTGLTVLIACLALKAVAAGEGEFSVNEHSKKTPSLAWPAPKVENRPGAYWWWLGSAVDKANLTWNLETMREAGMGGGTIVAIYGAKGSEKDYIQHLSPQWMEMMSHAVKEAKRLGMWVDMTPGTGWPFGGPMVTDEICDASVVYKNGKLSQKFSGSSVKRAAPGGKGKAINPYSARAMNEYLAHFDKAFDKDGIALPRALYHDSFEFKGNWTRELPEAFRRLRGYDLNAHLPELFGKGDKEIVARVKSDYRETLSDLHLEYMQALASWGKERGMLVRNQAHGSPSNLLDLYATASIPETETFGSSTFDIPGIRRDPDNNDTKNHPHPEIFRVASSAAHVAGRKLTASETCTWVRNHFREALSQVKPEIDQLFLSGINHIFFHGTCYSPKEAKWPGRLFYASLQYNPRNAIWRDSVHLNAYVTRCQSILQSGKPDNDIALYWPIYDIWHDSRGMQKQLTVHGPSWMTDSTCGKAAKWLETNGYGYDFISDRQLLAGLAKPYSAIVVPKTTHMPIATARELLEMSENGKPVIFLNGLPADVPGFHDFEKRRVEMKDLFKGRDALITELTALKDRLDKTSVAREPMVESGLKFIRRKQDHGKHYFVANMGKSPVDGWVALGTPFKSAVILDANSARTGVAPSQTGNEIYLQLLPGETRIIRTFRDKTVTGEAWPVLKNTGEPPLTIDGEWSVTFIDGGPKLPGPFKTRELKSWTELGDKEAKRFAGTGRYSVVFELPSTKADDWILDLGDVRESARVYVNGKMAEPLYSFPYSTPIGQFLKAGTNTLEIEVTNMSANRLRDLDRQKVNWRIFRDANVLNIGYTGQLNASKWPLSPSGLLGPVTLTPMKYLNP